MLLRELTITNYKNIENRKLEFSDSINCFVGNNGSGKTNLMDSIYYLCFGRSYFNRQEIFSIKHNENFAHLKGVFFDNEIEEIVDISISLENGKIIKKNGKVCKKISEYIGDFLAVMISPSDIDLINEGSQERRKFIDTIISLFDKEYLDNLINYNRILLHRNSLLKIFQEKNYFDMVQISVYDEKLSNLNDKIYELRYNFLEQFKSIFNETYNFITDSKEEVEIIYENNISENSLKSLIESHQKDLLSGQTSYGIHKDDFIFRIDKFPIKKYGSQGQQKSFLVSLKIAKYLFILKKTNRKSLLLLDDIFDKLDENRINRILNLVKNEKFSQIFISDTDKIRTENIVKNISDNYKFFVF